MRAGAEKDAPENALDKNKILETVKSNIKFTFPHINCKINPCFGFQYILFLCHQR